MSNSIQTDVSAMNASRNIKIHQKNIQSNMEKLSSGYKINSAADDAYTSWKVNIVFSIKSGLFLW